jgi:oligopeptide/dipeptide ABC transporter ATP-binding protein
MKPLIELDRLSIGYDTPDGRVSAVKDVSLSIHPREIYALVGESGCGKSTLAASIMRLVAPPGRVTGGRVLFDGVDLTELTDQEIVRYRGKRIGMIFQNPLDSFNPVLSIGSQISEAIMIDRVPRENALKLTVDILSDMQIADAAQRARAFPFELSGGMRQRAMIGMMISRNPELIIADEPTTALDVTIQAQILQLLTSLKERHDVSVLLITHNFGVVAEIADRIGVMYAGTLVEEGDVFSLFEAPRHPYTAMLISALPTIRKTQGRLTVIPGNVGRLIDPPAGCRFAGRCPYAMDVCRDQPAPWRAEGGHRWACHLEGGMPRG